MIKQYNFLKVNYTGYIYKRCYRCQCVFPGRTRLFLSVWVKWTLRRLQQADLTVWQSQTEADKDLTLGKHKKI